MCSINCLLKFCQLKVLVYLCNPFTYTEKLMLNRLQSQCRRFFCFKIGDCAIIVQRKTLTRDYQ